MSMIGEYLRVTPAELGRAVQDPRWAYDYAQEVLDSQEESDPDPLMSRCFSTHKAWDYLGFLLRRSQFPVDIHGEQSFAEDEDWGYGPPKALPAERVRVAAEALRRTDYDGLVKGLEAADLFGVYPGVWDRPDAIEWGREVFDSLTLFIGATAAAGDALLIWLD
ncbi:YfbM family protein [Catenulispora sp. GP43]|uniref:YfbM family protein n=1 Tax=Catenulispora sp. GP43 TaxID=3156263 RepID=UPI0035170DEB